MKKKLSLKLSTTQIILLSFLVVIAIGSLLLSLPISTQTGEGVPYMDALFTATTSTCVTGLVTVPTAYTWSLFGQVVILILIQVGGLGVITIMSGFMISLQHKMGIGERMLIQDSFNLNTLSGMVQFVKKVLLGSFLIELGGAIICMTVFVPEYGWRGIWISVFHSVSAFCNAGIDILAQDSICGYVFHPVINIVTALLIILGGIGYVVWWDVLRVMKYAKTWGTKCFRRLHLHSKIAITMTFVLIIAGAAAIFVFEYNNPLTMQEFTLGQKIQASLFQSVTTRTAGFATIPQENFTNASSFVSLLLMFIGGSPVGTAGGVKTVTIAILLASAFSMIRNKQDVELFDRTVSREAVHKAVAVVVMSFLIAFTSTVLLSAVTDAGAMDIMYETVSATATVGLSRNLTSTLNIWGKIIIIITMYFGRVGPISFAVLLNTKKRNTKTIKNPTEDISVG